MNLYFIKTKRTFSFIRKNGWIFTLLVGIGGLWYPKLGLLVIPIMLSLITTAFFNGRIWCGNFCPHGSLFDSIILKISNNKKIPKFFKSKLLSIGFFVFFGANLLRKFIKVINAWGHTSFLDKLGFVFVTAYLMVIVLGVFLAIVITPRTWCNFCPMGVLQKISYSIGKFLSINKNIEKKVTIKSKTLCHECGKCSRVCPMQLQPHKEINELNQLDNINCIKCNTCVENCPAGILSINNVKKAKEINKDVDLTGYKNRQKIKTKLVSVKEILKDTNEYTFKFIKPEKVSYRPGQFILVKIDDEENTYRAYSISSYNENDSELKVIIKKIKDGYGTSLIFDNFKEQDIIELEGPMGNELLIDKDAKDIVLVANGIGITPFIPIVKDLLENEDINSLKLLHGARYEHQFIYENYFKDYEEKYSNFEYIQIASRPKNKKFKKGYVTNVLKTSHFDDEKFYMCGTKNMIDDSIKILKEKGINDKNISYEKA